MDSSRRGWIVSFVTFIGRVLDPYGRPVVTLGLGVEGVIDSGLPRALQAPTPYARWGNALPAGLIGIVVLLIALLQVGQRRGGQRGSESP